MPNVWIIEMVSFSLLFFCFDWKKKFVNFRRSINSKSYINEWNKQKNRKKTPSNMMISFFIFFFFRLTLSYRFDYHKNIISTLGNAKLFVAVDLALSVSIGLFSHFFFRFFVCEQSHMRVTCSVEQGRHVLQTRRRCGKRTSAKWKKKM